MIYAATNNAIKEYSYEIKNSETPDKIVFLMINTSIILYTLKKAIYQIMS